MQLNQNTISLCKYVRSQSGEGIDENNRILVCSSVKTPLVCVNTFGRTVGGWRNLMGPRCATIAAHAVFKGRSIGELYSMDGEWYRRGGPYWYYFINYTIFLSSLSILITLLLIFIFFVFAYSRLFWSIAAFTIFLRVSLCIANSSPFNTLGNLRLSLPLSSHRCLGLPLGRLLLGFLFVRFYIIRLSALHKCPSHFYF